MQGYNAQAVVGEGEIVLAAEISTESLDTASLQPMVETALRELTNAGVAETPGAVLADAGYWKNDAIDALVAQGIQTLVARTPTGERNRGRAAEAGFMTSLAASWRPTGARSSTCGVRASSSPCSVR